MQTLIYLTILTKRAWIMLFKLKTYNLFKLCLSTEQFLAQLKKVS